MHRDAYYTLLIHHRKKKVPVSILQMNGRVSRENLVEDVFKSYSDRRVALVTHTAGQDPRLPRLPKDIVVPDYKTFTRIHQPHFMYRLLPLLCANVEAFAAMQAICASPGSPFTMTNRMDSQLLNYRFVKLCANRDLICEFFKEHTLPSELLQPTATRELPITGVRFQGLLLHDGLAKLRMSVAPSALATPVHAPRIEAAEAVPPNPSADGGSPGGEQIRPLPKPKKHVSVALVTTHCTLNHQAIAQRSIMTQFFRSCWYPHLGCSLAGIEVHSIEHQMHVMAVRRISVGRGYSAELRVCRRQLLEYAARENLHVYEKVAEGEYRYAAP